MDPLAPDADPFDPPAGSAWARVSPRLAVMRRTLVLVVGLPVAAGAAALGALASPAVAVALGAALVALVVVAVVAVGRNQRSWGYLERTDDLLVTHGALLRRLTVVPYGRMQLVDVEAGPVERLFGVVTVKLHTAAATTDAAVRGLTPELASGLRDRLTARGEAGASGL